MKTAAAGLVIALSLSACVLTPTQWERIADRSTAFQFQAYVPQRKWPVVLECANPADLKFVEIARIGPSRTANRDRFNRPAYLVQATIVVPAQCFDIGSEGRNSYWYAPVVASQLITNASGTYKSQDNIYTFDANGTACAGKALAQTRAFAAIVDRDCYMKNGDGSPRREVWVMTQPQYQGES
jgi:hypothetical protein